MSKSIYRRIFLTATLLLAVGVMPWWLTSLIFLAGVVFFPYYYEAVLAAFFFDLVYGASAVVPLGFQFSMTVIAILIVALVNELRPYVMMYR